MGFVQIRKDLAYPKAFIITKELNSEDGRTVSVKLLVETISSGPVVKQVSVTAANGQVRTTDMRFSIDDLLREAQVMVGKEVTQEDRTRTFTHLKGDYQREIDASWSSYIGRPTTLDLAHYQDVADTYRDAVDNGQNPIPAVAARFGVSEGSARRYVETARDKGIMGPAIRGKAGEKHRPERLRLD